MIRRLLSAAGAAVDALIPAQLPDMEVVPPPASLDDVVVRLDELIRITSALLPAPTISPNGRFREKHDAASRFGDRLRAEALGPYTAHSFDDDPIAEARAFADPLIAEALQDFRPRADD